jgi:hypothetical protein
MQEMDSRMIKCSLGYRQRTEYKDELFVILREPLQDPAGDAIVMRARDRAGQTGTEKEVTLHY